MGRRLSGNIAMIWDGWVAKPLKPGFGLGAAGRERGMPLKFRKFFSLDFAGEYVRSFLKLLLLVNPLWTFGVSFFSGEKTFGSILFRWGWDFLEASLVCLFRNGNYLGLFKPGKDLDSFGQNRDRPRHGIGWYLLFLAFLIPPGLVLALHLMVGLVNWFTVCPTIEPLVPMVLLRQGNIRRLAASSHLFFL